MVQTTVASASADVISRPPCASLRQTHKGQTHKGQTHKGQTHKGQTHKQYIYGIIPTADRLIFDVAGVDDDDDEVYTVPDGELAAVVGRTARTDYQGMTRQEAVRYLVSHQRVLETVMDAFPVLPVKFGTVLPDERWVHRLLAQGESLFRTTLEKFADRVQMEVVVLWNLQEIFQEIGQEEPIARLKTQIASLPPDQMATARVAIGQMVYASLERRRTALRDRLLPPLREVALDIVVNPLMDDSMVANVALLVVGDARQGEDSRAEAEEEEHSAPWPDRQPVLWPGTGDRLDQRLEMLDKEFEGRLHFRCVGPLPPYSFATIEVRVPSFDEVDEARRRLGLGETATFAEVRRAYHRLASRLHPDHNHDAQEAESRMAELTRAYRLLTSYAEAVQGGGGAEEQGGGGAERNSPQHPSTPAPPLIFSREAVERTLLIAIRRQEPPAGGG